MQQKKSRGWGWIGLGGACLASVLAVVQPPRTRSNLPSRPSEDAATGVAAPSERRPVRAEESAASGEENAAESVPSPEAPGSSPDGR